jgi:biotin carboxyl carrier protein
MSDCKKEILITHWSPPAFTAQIPEGVIKGSYFRGKNFVDIHLPQGTFRILDAPSKKRSSSQKEEGDLTAPMPGKIIKICAKTGDTVKSGDVLMVLEAMKMEHKIISPQNGTVEKLKFQEGDRVQQGEILLEIKT